MKEVNVYNRVQANELESDGDTCFISIWTPPPGGSYDSEPTWFGWADFIKLIFCDISKPWQDWQMFDEKMAGRVLELIRNNLDKNVAVHCDAGISRSVAIGCFLRDFLGYNLKLNAFESDTARNPHVYDILAKEYKNYFKSVSI